MLIIDYPNYFAIEEFWNTYPDLRECINKSQPLLTKIAKEISIRAATVVAVKKLVLILANSSNDGKDGTKKDSKNTFTWNAVQVDWYLWQVGKKMDAAAALAPHHRVRTIYY